jgi:hypothetical protein
MRLSTLCGLHRDTEQLGRRCRQALGAPLVPGIAWTKVVAAWAPPMPGLGIKENMFNV